MATDEGMLRPPNDSLDKPSAARVYDYYIGGNHHYAIDRDFADKVAARLPLIPQSANTCRQFLGRAVRYCTERTQGGIAQFVDIGSGLPTTGNVHEVADEVRPALDTRVLYIDNEPIALAHSQILLADSADENRHKAIAGDLLRPVDLWTEVVGAGIIDVSQPIVLVINAVLHFIKDEQEPDAALAFYRDRLAPGSMIVLSQITNENPANEEERQALLALAQFYEGTTNPGQMRTSEEFSRFFGDWDLVEPGLVYAPAWHPDERTLFAHDPSKSRIIAGVARKP